MELNYDWKTYQKVMGCHLEQSQTAEDGQLGPIYTLIEGDSVVAAFSPNEDLSEWTGVSVEKFGIQFQGRQLVAIDQQDADQWLTEMTEQDHFIEQLDFLNEKAKHNAHQHFLLNAVKTWWARVFPSSYGIFVRQDNDLTTDFIVIMRRGKLETFQQPDLSSMGADLVQQPDAVVKYLSEKHMIAIQGIFCSREEWETWSSKKDPWREVAASIRKNNCKLVPFRWGLVSLIASKAIVGV